MLGSRWHLPPACWLKSRRLQRLRVLIRGSCAIGAALALPDIPSYHRRLASFRIYGRMWNLNVILNRAETSDGKPLQSHVVLAIGQLFWPRDSHWRHSRSKQRFSVGAFTLFATLESRWHLPTACWLKSRRLQRLRVLIRGSCAIGAALALPDIPSYHMRLASFRIIYGRMWNLNVILNRAETSDGKPLPSHVVLAIGQLFWPRDGHSHSKQRLQGSR